MCGIVGYIGDKKASNILIDCLKRLEYRGYDSAGIAVINDDQIETVKDRGRVKNIENNALNLMGTIGIGHTRWATHGKPSKENAHPHKCGKYSVVHNGIIENYSEIKDFLIKKNYVFSSDTDTEVISALLNFCETGNLLFTVRNAIKKLTGSFALAVISESYPNKIVVVRQNSPLIVGEGLGEYFIASDVHAITPYTDTFFNMADGEIGVIEKTKAEFFDFDLNFVYKKPIKINIENATDDYGEKEYMLKEITEIPKAINNTISYLKSLKIPKELIYKLNSCKKIHIIGCGTAYNSGLIGKYLIEKYARINVEVEISSEFRYKNPIIDNNDLVIAVSQSGETADTLAGVKQAKKSGAYVISITNNKFSSIEEFSDFIFYTIAGEEIAVAATKSYNCQLIVFYFLTELIVGLSENKLDFLGEIGSNLDLFESILNNNKIKELSEKIYDKSEVFYLGRGVDYYLAIEAALKLKEISYINCSAYPAGELKHGTLALIEQKSIAIFIITQKNLAIKTLNAVHEVKTRGAYVIVFSQFFEMKDNLDIDEFFLLPSSLSDDLIPVFAIVPLQLLSFYTAKKRKLDVDKPRNLAKSVTVE